MVRSRGTRLCKGSLGLAANTSLKLRGLDKNSKNNYISSWYFDTWCRTDTSVLVSFRPKWNRASDAGVSNDFRFTCFFVKFDKYLLIKNIFTRSSCSIAAWTGNLFESTNLGWIPSILLPFLQDIVITLLLVEGKNAAPPKYSSFHILLLKIHSLPLPQ